MDRRREDCAFRVAGQGIDIRRSPGPLPLPPVPAPALAAVLAARIAGVSVRLWRVGAAWSIPPRTLDDDFLFLPLAGRIVFGSAGGEAPLAPGGLGIAPVGVRHHARHAPGGRDFTVVAVHAHLRDPGGSPLLAGLAAPVLPLADHPGWAERLLLAAVADPPAPELLAHTLRVLLAGLAATGLALRPAAGRGDPRLAPAFAALHDHPEAPHPIPALARACGLGAVRFRQLFRHAAGCAPKPYLDRLRLARARDLLRATREPVAAIAAACGFPTTRHFLARFRAAAGMTPTAWRHGGGEGP